MFNYRLDDRVIQIIEIGRRKPFTTIDYLASSLGVSTRTIRNDIKKLNNELKGIAAFVNEKGKGFRLFIEDVEKFKNVIGITETESNLYDSPKRRIAFIIDKLINEEETPTLDELAFEMNIGRTTLVNELKKAAVTLETYKLSIIGKPNHGMLLNGKEVDIRFFILDNIFNYLYGDFPLDEDIKDEISRVSNDHDLESTTQTALLQFIIIMLDRMLKEHTLTEISERHKALKGTNDFKIAENIAEIIEKSLPIKIPESEILFMTIPIAGRRTPTTNRTMAEITVPDDVKRLLVLIVEQLGFNKRVIEENESFFKDLQYHLTFMLNRLFYGLRLKNPLLADVKEKYPLAYKLSEMAGQVIKREYGYDVSEDELGYIAFYFGVFIAQSEGKMKRLNKAAVICGTGRGTAKLVSIQLERILKQDTEIDLFSDTDVSSELLNSYDIVFSTVRLPVKTKTPAITINEIFDENSVAKKIEEVTYMHNLKLKQEVQSVSFMRHVVSDEKFFLLNSEKSYEENVEEMVKALVDTGYLDTEFQRRLNERMQKGSMVFDNSIAFPHTMNTLSDKIELAIGVFPQAITTENKEVKLIFLLGVPEQQTDNTEHLLVKIYDEIIRIANDSSLLTKLGTSRSYDEFIEIHERSYV